MRPAFDMDALRTMVVGTELGSFCASGRMCAWAFGEAPPVGNEIELPEAAQSLAGSSKTASAMPFSVCGG